MKQALEDFFTGHFWLLDRETLFLMTEKFTQDEPVEKAE